MSMERIEWENLLKLECEQREREIAHQKKLVRVLADELVRMQEHLLPG
jgi:NADH:ubiquinone oxidoreductase subunit D